MSSFSTVTGKILKVFLLSIIIALCGCLEDSASLDTNQHKKVHLQLTEAKNHRRRIIVNNDGSDYPRKPETAEMFLSKRIAPLMGTQVDSIFYSTPYAHLIQTVKLVDNKGNITDHDHFSAVIDFCRKNNKEVFWSMRMNESNDSNIENGLKLNNWKLHNRAYLMSGSYTSFPYGWVNRPTWPWTAMNYDNIEVRSHVVEVIADVCERYDVDGIELDFWRWPVLFKNQLLGRPVTQAQCDKITEMLSWIRRVTEIHSARNGKPILISVRVPDSIGYSKGIGIDLVKWLDMQLVDMVVAGGYFQLQPWEHVVNACKQYDTPVYACLSRSRIPNDTEIFRGEAMAAWQQGVDGIYLFNAFDVNKTIFSELGNMSQLAQMPRKDRYSLGHVEWLHVQRMGTILKDGEKFFNPALLAKWTEPVPQINDPINIGFEPGRNVKMVYTTDQYKLDLDLKNGTYELYDIINDPNARKDIAKEMPDVFEPMKKQLNTWQSENESILFSQ